MSDYTQTISTVIGVGAFLTGGGALVARGVMRRLDRVVDAYEQVAGKPEKTDRAGRITQKAVVGLTAKVDDVRDLAVNANVGNLEIMRKQDEARVEHEKLAGRVDRIESKVSQTLNAVTP